MSPTPEPEIAAAVAASPLLAVYGTAVDRESAREILTAKMNAAAAAAQAVADAEAREEGRGRVRQAGGGDQEADRRRGRRAGQGAAHGDAEAARAAKEQAARAKAQGRVIKDVLGSPATRTILTGVLAGIFGTRKRR